MNVENLRIIIDAIENNPDLYDQSEWGNIDRTPNGLLDHGCSTPGCLSGWALFLFPQAKGCGPRAQLTKVLEITPLSTCLLTDDTWPVAWFLKVGMEGGGPLRGDKEPTVDEAVTILKAMADEGLIWDQMGFDYEDKN